MSHTDINGKRESLSYVNDVVGLLSAHRIPSCVVGELALNYFNVPRVVHTIEICVPEYQYGEAAKVLDAQEHLLERVEHQRHTLYTEYQRHCSRYRYVTNPILDVLLFPDEQFGLNLSEQTVVAESQHSETAQYSLHILTLLCVNDLLIMPIPALPALLRGICRIYKGTSDIMYAVAAEQLVDGMNIDASWCQRHFHSLANGELEFLMELIENRSARIEDFSTNLVTCFVSNETEAQRVQHIPGRG